MKKLAINPSQEDANVTYEPTGLEIEPYRKKPKLIEKLAPEENIGQIKKRRCHTDGCCYG